MPIKLHRCPITWPKTDLHPCERVQKALDDAGVEYEVVKVAWPRTRARPEVEAGTGKKHVPAIQFEDGTWYREESAAMAAKIRAGELGKSS